MVEELSQKYLDLLQRLHMRFNDEMNDDLTSDPMQTFHTHTPDGVPIRKLFVANLAERTTYRDLNKLFSKYGKLDACYLKRNSNRSNYAFVTFSDPHDALKARLEGHRKEIRLHNRDLRVLSADSWHQPDNIECQNKIAQLKSKSTISNEISPWDQEGEKDPSLINKLNDDCLMHIFQFLPVLDRVRIERVCKRWRTVSLNSWHSYRSLNVASISRKYIFPTDTPSLRKVLLRCGQFLTEISCCSERHFTMSNSTLTIITKLCPNIQKLDISGILMAPSGINSLIRTYSNLVELKLGASGYRCDNDLKTLFINNPKLKKLEIANVQINGTCLTALPATLEELNLRCCYDILSNNLCKAIQKLKKLKSLTVVHCQTIYDCVLEEMSKCPNIHKLVLKGSFPLLSQEGMLNIAHISNLRDLDAQECVNLVKDTFLAKIAFSCTNLTALNITKCEKITNEGISKVFSLPNLQYLEMAYLTITEFTISQSNIPLKLKMLNCEAINDLSEKSVCAVIEGAPNLEILILNFCYRLTQNVVDVAVRCTKKRTNDILLKLEAHETAIVAPPVTSISPLLHIVNFTHYNNSHYLSCI